MTYAEATQLLGPEVCARIDARVAEAPPLSPERVEYLADLFDIDELDRATDAA